MSMPTVGPGLASGAGLPVSTENDAYQRPAFRLTVTLMMSLSNRSSSRIRTHPILGRCTRHPSTLMLLRPLDGVKASLRCRLRTGGKPILRWGLPCFLALQYAPQEASPLPMLMMAFLDTCWEWSQDQSNRSALTALKSLRRSMSDSHWPPPGLTSTWAYHSSACCSSVWPNQASWNLPRAQLAATRAHPACSSIRVACLSVGARAIRWDLPSPFRCWLMGSWQARLRTSELRAAGAPWATGGRTDTPRTP